MKLNWNPKKFKQALTAGLVANAEIVGKFVESDARRRLLAMPDLAGDVRVVNGVRYLGRGAAYRRYVAGLMGNDVEADSRGVTVRVGVRPGRGGTHHGLYIEMGSKNTPASPFLRPAVFENAGKIVGLLAGK